MQKKVVSNTAASNRTQRSQQSTTKIRQQLGAGNSVFDAGIDFTDSLTMHKAKAYMGELNASANGFDASNDGYFDDTAIRQKLIDNTFGDPTELNDARSHAQAAELRYARYQAQALVNNASGRWQSYTNPMFAGHVPYEEPIKSVQPELWVMGAFDVAKIGLWGADFYRECLCWFCRAG